MIGKDKRKDEEMRNWIAKLEASHFLGRFGPVVIAGFIVIIVTLALLDIRAVFEPPLLLPMLNTVFLCIMPCAVAYISARSYLANGSLTLLLLGCGTLTVGSGGLIAGWLIGPLGGPNVNVTIYNIGALLASAFHLVGVALASVGLTPQRASRPGKSEVILAYLGVLIFMALLTIASLQGAIPLFFIQGVGPTLLRQGVLGTAVALFALSSLLLMRLYSSSKSAFLYWYSIALALIALGLSGVLLQKSVGSPIGWAGRSAQYLGGICFLMAVLTAIRDARAKGIAVERAMVSFFREAEEFYRALVETVTDAIICIDHEGRILLWNSAAVKTFGYSRDEAVGSILIDLIVPDQHADSLRRGLGNLARTGSGLLNGTAIEIQAKKKDGKVFPVELSVSARKAADGWISTMIMRDITERKQAEEALRDSEEKYHSLVESTDDSIYLVDKDCTYLFMNQKHLSRFDLSIDKVLGRAYGEFHSEEEAKDFAEKVKEVFETGKSLSYEYRSRRSGEYFLRTLSPVKEPGGRTRAVTVVSKDITDRKRAKEALKESEEKYRTLAENSLTGVQIHQDGKFVFVNDRFAQMHGYEREELLGKHHLTLIHPDHRELVEQRATQRLKGEAVSPCYEIKKLRKDGKIICCEIMVTRVQYRGKPAIMGNTVDITERKQAQDALRRRGQELRMITDNVPGLISYLDADGYYRFVNRQCQEWFGLSPKDIIGKHYRPVVGNATYKRIKEHVQAVLSGKRVHYEEALPYKHGARRWVHAEYVPNIGDQGEVKGFFALVTDITERKQAEEEKKKLEAQFQAAQRMEAVGTLAGGIAHDFNNLLMGILGNASLMLLEKTSDHPDFERLKSIEQGVRSGAELTKQILGFAMGGRYVVKPTDLNELIKRSSQMFGRTKKEITIHRKYHKGIWPVEVDQGQIDQVLLNLYVNAWQAMPAGGELYLETQNTTLDENYVKPYSLEPGRYVKISVTDTGVGMDKATQQRIFDPFFTTREMGRGTGLGLASVYGIIRNHEGIITVDSKKGEGATFTIFLPASEREVIKDKELLPEEVLKGTETVLLVDDEEMVLEVGEEMLKELGYTVLVARGGREAIEIVSKAPRWSRLRTPQGKHTLSPASDIVILDMIMPGMGGGEAYDRLMEINPTIKVLLSSGYSIDGQATEILERGCNGFIQKPFSMRDLSWRIREILDQG